MFKGQELIPRIVVVFGIVIGLFGIGGYLKSATIAPETQLTKQPRRFAEQAMPVAQAATKDASAAETQSANKGALAVPETPTPVQKAEARELPRPAQPRVETSPEVYLCGAQTAKGTPCKHRVKRNVRCFQHAGMPAMLPADKLRIN